MALYELVMRSTFVGQEIINRWNYVSSGVPAVVSGSFGLVTAFFGGNGAAPPATSIVGEMLDILVNGWQLRELEARAIYVPTDFYTRPFITPVVGEQSGAEGSPFEAYGFRTTRVRTDIARGTKRLAGVAQAGIGDGGVIGASFLTQVQEVATAMSDVLTYDDEGNTITYTPAIVQKEEYTTPSGKRAYRYYATEAAQLEHVATGFLWEAYDTLRSQTSRQYGRGR